MKNIDKIQFLAQISFCNYYVAEGGPVQREGVISWQDAFSNMGLYWPRGKKLVARNINFPKSFFLWNTLFYMHNYTLGPHHIYSRVILVNMEISVILGHEKTKIQNILDLGKIDVFSVRTNIYIKNKKMGHLI